MRTFSEKWHAAKRPGEQAFARAQVGREPGGRRVVIGEPDAGAVLA